MFIVGKENTEMDVKNEGGNLWCGRRSFSPYVPHPPYPQQDVLPMLRVNTGVAIPIWTPFLEDKEERVPGVYKEWIRIFLKCSPSFSGFPT